MIVVRQSTARTVTIGPVLDATGVAVTDGVVGDFKISKNGAAPAALNGSATLTHRNTGHYSLALTTSDLDTVGQVEIVIDDTVNACPIKELSVIEEAVYDALFAASALGYIANAPVNVAQFGGTNGTFSAGRPEVNTTHLSGTSQTARDIGASVLLSNGTGTGQLKLASGYVAMTWADIAAPTTAVNLSGTTIAWNAAWDAEVQSECADALTAYGTSTLSAAAAADAVWDEVLAGHLTGGSTGAALNAAGSAGDPWSTALPGAYSAGTAGKIIGDNINATITSRMASYTQPTGFLAATFPATVASTTNITAGTITTVTNLTNAPTSGDLTTTMKTSVQTELSTYGALKPTTAGRTLDVTTTGEAGIDWSNIGGKTTVVDLSNTSIKTATDIQTVTDQMVFTNPNQLDVYVAAINGGNAEGLGLIGTDYFNDSRIRARVTLLDDGVISATTLDANAITANAIATDAGTEIGTAVWAIATRTLTAGTNIVLAKGVGVTGFNDLSAAQVNSEVDTALADYDGPTNAEMVARTLPSASYGLEATSQSILADTGTDGVVVSTTTQAAIADKLLGRRISGGADGTRTVSQALATSRNKVTRSGSTLTVYDVDDTTVLWTATLTSDPAVDLITGVDPG